jgi:hypothetical protein
MPFPTKDGKPPPPRRPAGKTKRRKYVVWYCNKYKESADESNWHVGLFPATSVNGAHNAVVRDLKAKGWEGKKSEVLLMEVHILPLRMTLEQYLGGDEEEE